MMADVNVIECDRAFFSKACFDSLEVARTLPLHLACAVFLLRGSKLRTIVRLGAFKVPESYFVPGMYLGLPFEAH